MRLAVVTHVCVCVLGGGEGSRACVTYDTTGKVEGRGQPIGCHHHHDRYLVDEQRAEADERDQDAEGAAETTERCLRGRRADGLVLGESHGDA